MPLRHGACSCERADCEGAKNSRPVGIFEPRAAAGDAGCAWIFVPIQTAHARQDFFARFGSQRCSAQFFAGPDIFCRIFGAIL